MDFPTILSRTHDVNAVNGGQMDSDGAPSVDRLEFSMKLQGLREESRVALARGSLFLHQLRNAVENFFSRHGACDCRFVSCRD